jgi:hypothetical protein
MSEKIQEWEAELNAIAAEFQSFKSLTVEQFNFKPNPKTWSIGQVIDHIIVINETYYPIFDSLQDGTFKLPIAGKFSWAVNFFGKLIHDSVEPTRKKKRRTISIWEPSSSNISLEILDRFAEHQREFIKRMKQLEPLIEKNVTIHSPAGKMIVYKLEKAFDIIVSHERRHLNQARELHSKIQAV